MGDFKIFVDYVKNGNLEQVINCFRPDFLEKKIDYSMMTRRIFLNNRQPIHYACEGGYLEIVKFLVENKCSIECEDEKKMRPIDYACQGGHLEIVNFFVENRCNIECEDGCKRPIHYACQGGHLEIVKFLVENKCSIECEDNLKMRPIDYACQGGHLEIVNFLVENGCNIECEDGFKRSIHYACEGGYLEIVKFLVENKFSIECGDKDNKRPIHYACQGGHLEIVKFLVENKCSIECEDNLKKRSIHYAWQGRHLKIVIFLMQNKCSFDCEDNFKKTSIHYACEVGQLGIVKFLVQNKCRIEFEDKNNKRPIHYACQGGHLEIVKFLVENKCSTECEDENKKRSIHYACEVDQLEIVKLLVENKCSTECEDENNKRPIHYACQGGHLEIVKFLVENKCSIECEDNFNRRPVHYASGYGHLEVVKFLCECHCELDSKNKHNQTPVGVAKRYKRTDCEDYLNEIQKNRNIFVCVRRDHVHTLIALYSPAIFKMEENGAGSLLLEVAVQSEANEIINYLLNKLVNAEELLILERCMKSCSRPNAVQLLQECLLYRSIRLYDAERFYLYSKAKTINGHKKLINASFLQVAAEFGCNAFIDALLKKSIYDEEEWTKAKNMAIRKGHAGIAEAISDRERLLRKRSDNNFTLLHSAVCDNDPDMITFILEQYLVNPDSNNEVVGTGLALSHMMCYDKCIEVLENFNVDVNTQNKYSQSPLHEAIGSGMTDHCSYLISRAEDIDRPGFMGLTGLQYAVIKGCEDLCDELVQNDADCHRYVEILQQSSINKTVLPISKTENAITLCMKIHETIYPCFLEELDEDSVNCCDEDGNSLLHMAVKCLQPSLCNTLIKSGSNVEAINDQGNSPLFELFSPGYNQHDNVEKVIATLNILLEHGIDLNTISSSGLTVLEGASQWNSERLMVSLLLNQSEVACVTGTDFKLAFTKHWFEYATTLINIMTEDCLKTVITGEIFHLAMPHCDSKLLMSLFVKSTCAVQQLVIEDVLDYFALMDKNDEFLSLLKIEIIKPKLFANGETLLTSLLKKRNLKYCWSIINCATNKRCIVWSNAINETPLQISVETDLFDFMNPLIINCDDETALHYNWHDALIPLFQKLSTSTNNDIDQKLLASINAIICRGRDIYKKTPAGEPIINYCTRYKERIETFKNNEARKEQRYKKICSICLDMEVNCVFDCGHTFCMVCGEKLHKCPICNAKLTKRMKLYFN